MNGDGASKTPLEFDKKLIFEIVVVVILLGAAAWLYFGGAFNRAPGDVSYAPPGDCLILPQEYCDAGKLTVIDLDDTEGMIFDLPIDTPIYMPFDGAYFDETLGGQSISTMQLGIIKTSSFVVLTGEYVATNEPDTFISKGNLLATIKEGSSVAGEEGASNLVIYTLDYELSNLFK